MVEDDGWNNYGIAIRDVVGQMQDLENAIAAVESFNADRDESSLSNLEEITLHLDPGRRYGSGNPFFSKIKPFLKLNQLHLMILVAELLVSLA